MVGRRPDSQKAPPATGRFTAVPSCRTFLAEPDTYHAAGIERGTARELPGAPASVVTITLRPWRVISADSHPISGGSTFSVGTSSTQVVAAPSVDPDQGVQWVAAGAQALTYLGVLGAAGLTAFVSCSCYAANQLRAMPCAAAPPVCSQRLVCSAPSWWCR